MARLPLLAFSLLAALATTARPAAAQQVPSPYRFVDQPQSLHVFAGYMVADQGALDLGPKNGPVVGARYGLRLGSGPLDAEALLVYFSSARTVYDTLPAAPFQQAVGTVDLAIASLIASLRLNLTGPRTYHRFMPYVSAGGGVSVEVSGDQALDQSVPAAARFDFGTRFAGQLGTGVEWFATRRLTFRAEAEDILWKLRTPPAFLRKEMNVGSSDWTQNFQFTLGAGYRF